MFCFFFFFFWRQGQVHAVCKLSKGYLPINVLGGEQGTQLLSILRVSFLRRSILRGINVTACRIQGGIVIFDKATLMFPKRLVRLPLVFGDFSEQALERIVRHREVNVRVFHYNER
uniref:Putative secreted protein n=1 Tax=Rhipicephalus microplus TaxID=6941 RepID=A0A6M2D9E8_RHIMP